MRKDDLYKSNVPSRTKNIHDWLRARDEKREALIYVPTVDEWLE